MPSPFIYERKKSKKIAVKTCGKWGRWGRVVTTPRPEGEGVTAEFKTKIPTFDFLYFVLLSQ